MALERKPEPLTNEEVAAALPPAAGAPAPAAVKH
jgi:hypothetical protein